MAPKRRHEELMTLENVPVPVTSDNEIANEFNKLFCKHRSKAGKGNTTSEF